MYLSIVIPAYNEEKRITKTLLEIKDYLQRQNYDYEVIVANDGSRDKTAEVVGNIMADFPELKIISDRKNHGKGYAVRRGLLAARGECRLFMDADNSTKIDEVENFLPYFAQGYDIVIGSRRVENSVITNPQPALRKFLGNFFVPLANAIVGLKNVSDSQCGFKVFSARAAADIFSKCGINRWSFDPEILVIAQKLGYKIKEAPVRWANNRQSKVRPAEMFMAIIDLFKIKWNLIAKKY